MVSASPVACEITDDLYVAVELLASSLLLTYVFHGWTPQSQAPVLCSWCEMSASSLAYHQALDLFPF